MVRWVNIALVPSVHLQITEEKETAMISDVQEV
jgi:hypothetical protein